MPAQSREGHFSSHGCSTVVVGIVVGQPQGMVTVERRRHSLTVQVVQIDWLVMVGQEAAARLE